MRELGERKRREKDREIDYEKKMRESRNDVENGERERVGKRRRKEAMEEKGTGDSNIEKSRHKSRNKHR